MKLEGKYLFPISSSGTNSYIYKLPECPGMRKILAYIIRMQEKNSQTREDIFWISRIFLELCVSKVQLAPPHGNFINGVANPEIVCTLHKVFIIILLDGKYNCHNTAEEKISTTWVFLTNIFTLQNQFGVM